jgi:hypothetical protein
MGISKESQEKLAYLWKDENTIEWIQTFIRIADKNGDIVPFILTDEQRELVNSMIRENIILKSRQLGISSVVVALSIRACIVKDNTTCLLVSHNQSSTNTIFDKLKQQFNSLPDWIKPELMTNNRQELKFVNGSKITCLTAGNKEIGRGDTFTGIVHLSEFAFYKNPEKQLKALSQALSDTGKIIIESTADGFNKFSEVYYQAKNNENSYKSYFFNWINGGRLFKELYQSSVEKYKARNNGNELTVDNLDADEIELYNIGATLEQLTWRREKIATDGVDAFHVEYPSSDDEAFMTTGSQIFDTKRIDSCIKAIITDKVIFIPKTNITTMPVILQNLYPKSLKIWSIPKMGERYYIGCDVSEGLGKDYSTAIVFNKQGEQVAQLKNNVLKPYQVADVLDALGRFYNKAMLTVEKASGGHSVIERLRYEKHYMNMTKYVTYDIHNKAIWNVGFDTNNKTKSIIINDMREWFEKGLILIRSQEVLEEMKVFISNDNGSMGAISGSHDDLVMGTALGIVGLKSNVWYPF